MTIKSVAMKGAFLAIILFFHYYVSQGQTIQGLFTPGASCPVTYTYDAGVLLTGITWTVTNGTVNSTQVSGTQYSAIVTWTAAGSGTIRIKDTADGILDTESVTVNSVGALST